VAKLQFRILFRQFLFRIIDLELLAADARGDAEKLLGRFAAVLIAFSGMQGVAGMFFSGRHMPPERLRSIAWQMEHSFICTTMLAVGIFVVLSWDSTFPNRRDVLVLAPLPVTTRIIFFAKVSGAAAALGITVLCLNATQSFTWALHFASDSAALALPRAFLAYWVTMFASGAFTFCILLGVQGLSAQLPRKLFLRASAFLQIAAFGFLVIGYFLEPNWNTPRLLSDPAHRQLLAWLPPYWFLGLYQALNGTMHPVLAPLATRAIWALGIAAFAGGSAFLLAYFRTMRKIVEQPDILPTTGGLRWLPRFGHGLPNAVVQFSIRTLLRSRQHRVIFAFYLGVGLALVTLIVKDTRIPLSRPGQPGVLAATLILSCAWIFGARAVFGMPMELRANWIFRITQVHGVQAYMTAGRRPLFVLGIAPVILGSAAVLFTIWPWQPAAKHLVILALWGVTVSYACLYGFQKVPFTCSYLPGKSQLHMRILSLFLVFPAVASFVSLEMTQIGNNAAVMKIAGVMATVALIARWLTVAQANDEFAEVLFEETETPAVMTLGIQKDGAAVAR
jgi:hypothetical protein